MRWSGAHGLTRRLWNLGVKSTSAIKCLGNFRNFQFISEIHWQKNCQRFSRNLCMLYRQWLRHTLAFCRRLWFGFLIVEITCSTELYCLPITHLNSWNRRQYFCHWSPCFGFFVCSCYSRRTHHPMLEKCSAQNNREWCKKDKITDLNTSFNKRVHILQNQIKALRKRKFVFYLLI